MALGTDDGKTARIAYLLAQLDIGTTTRHVGGYGNGARETRLGNDVRLLLVELGVEHVVRYLAYGKQTAEEL